MSSFSRDSVIHCLYSIMACVCKCNCTCCWSLHCKSTRAFFLLISISISHWPVAGHPCSCSSPSPANNVFLHPSFYQCLDHWSLWEVQSAAEAENITHSRALQSSTGVAVWDVCSQHQHKEELGTCGWGTVTPKAIGSDIYCSCKCLSFIFKDQFYNIPSYPILSCPVLFYSILFFFFFLLFVSVLKNKDGSSLG